MSDDFFITEERFFSGPEACRFTGVSYRQLDYWARTGRLQPSARTAQGSGTQRAYTYVDLVSLALMKALLDEGLTLERATELVRFWRGEGGGVFRSDYDPLQADTIEHSPREGVVTTTVHVDRVRMRLNGRVWAARVDT